MRRSEVGKFPIRTLVLKVVSRRALVVGAGGLAILAAIPKDERQEIISRVAPHLPTFGNLTEPALEDACDQASEHGIAVIQNRVSLGVTAVGVHFSDSMGQAIGAISVAALTQRMPPSRIRSISERLKLAAEEIEVSLRQRRRPMLPSAA